MEKNLIITGTITDNRLCKKFNGRLSSHQIEKAIRCGDEYRLDDITFKIVGENYAEAIYDDGGIEFCNFVRHKWAVRVEKTYREYNDTLYDLYKYDSQEQAVDAYTNWIRMISQSEDYKSATIIECWV